MSNVIYYFSATGNSLTTARRIAQEMGGCRLIPVMSTRSSLKIYEESDAVGFDLCGGLPLIGLRETAVGCCQEGLFANLVDGLEVLVTRRPLVVLGPFEG